MNPGNRFENLTGGNRLAAQASRVSMLRQIVLSDTYPLFFTEPLHSADYTGLNFTRSSGHTPLTLQAQAENQCAINTIYPT